MPTAEEICNKAMVILGASMIGSLAAPTTPNARTLALLYPMARNSEIRKRRWRFAKQTDALPKDATWTGTYPRAYRYQLHAATVRTSLEKYSDWIIQGGYVYTDCNEATLYVEVFRSDVNTALYDPCFCDALAARIADDACETITQSNTKKADARKAYREAIATAGRINAFEIGPVEPPFGSWAQQLGG